MLWFRKTLAVYLIAIGFALLVLRFPAELKGEGSRELVVLEVAPAPWDRAAARAEFGSSFVELSYDSLETTPAVREAILALMGDGGGRCVPAAEWAVFVAQFATAQAVGTVYSFRGHLYRIDTAEPLTDSTGQDDELTCFEASVIGTYDNLDWAPMSRPDPARLGRYPALEAELERLAAGPVPAAGGRVVPPSEWRRFQRKELDDDRRDFVVLDRLFRGSIDEQEVPWTIQTPWLRPTAQAIGAALLVLGLVLLVRAYRRAGARAGIPVAPPWLAVFSDVVVLAAACFLMPIALDCLWVGPLAMKSLVGLEPEWLSTTPITGLHFVSWPGLLVLAVTNIWFVSLSAQRILIDSEQIISDGALGATCLRWDDLESIRVRDQHKPVQATVVDFRTLQRVLELEGADVVMTINQPHSFANRTKILDALRRHIPADKQQLLEGLEELW